jgi:hypothetical protein
VGIFDQVPKILVEHVLSIPFKHLEGEYNILSPATQTQKSYSIRAVCFLKSLPDYIVLKAD